MAIYMDRQKYIVILGGDFNSRMVLFIVLISVLDVKVG